jgi:EAL domain-containing protein (putative c-di-GMP-specific phosphodiesterase class I)
VIVAASGAEALALIERGHAFDVIFSDIFMPDMSGLELVRALRRAHVDSPVVIMTGNPALESATLALEVGAIRYLTKPVEPELLCMMVEQALASRAHERLLRQALAEVEADAIARAHTSQLAGNFQRGLDALWMAYQPILRPGQSEIFAHEALLRTRESTIVHAGAFIDAAERLGRLEELGRLIRSEVAAALRQVGAAMLFVNLHPLELLDPQLYSDDNPLAPFAQQVAFEVTERAALELIHDLPERIGRLRALGYRIALDDLGAGYSGLGSIPVLKPDIVKIDMSLVRGIHRSTMNRKLVGSLITLCHEMNALVVAEGVECAEERDTLIALDCDLMQGYLFARPNAELRTALL